MAQIKIKQAEIRNAIKAENELINQRLTWLGTFQGLLLAALAFAWDKQGATLFVPTLCFIGALVALSIWVATLRANDAINNLVQKWDQVKPKRHAGLDVEGTRSKSGWFWWLMPGYFVPGLFVFGWIAISAIHAYRI